MLKSDATSIQHLNLISLTSNIIRNPQANVEAPQWVGRSLSCGYFMWAEWSM